MNQISSTRPLHINKNTSDSAGGTTSNPSGLNFPTTVQVTLSDGAGGHVSPSVIFEAGRQTEHVAEVGQLAGASRFSRRTIVVGHAHLATLWQLEMTTSAGKGNTIPSRSLKWTAKICPSLRLRDFTSRQVLRNRCRRRNTRPQRHGGTNTGMDASERTTQRPWTSS